ncbi:membrane-associated protein, putative, partial [Bodo saltans]
MNRYGNGWSTTERVFFFFFCVWLTRVNPYIIDQLPFLEQFTRRTKKYETTKKGKNKQTENEVIVLVPRRKEAARTKHANSNCLRPLFSRDTPMGGGLNNTPLVVGMGFSTRNTNKPKGWRVYAEKNDQKNLLYADEI